MSDKPQSDTPRTDGVIAFEREPEHGVTYGYTPYREAIELCRQLERELAAARKALAAAVRDAQRYRWLKASADLRWHDVQKAVLAVVKEHPEYKRRVSAAMKDKP